MTIRLSPAHEIPENCKKLKAPAFGCRTFFFWFAGRKNPESGVLLKRYAFFGSKEERVC